MNQNQEIYKICKNGIAQFIQNCDLRSVSFPIFKNTYTLWRKMAFKAVKESNAYANDKQKSLKQFCIESQLKLLRRFINKLKEENQFSLEELKKLMGQQNSQGQNIQVINTAENEQLILEFGSVIWKQALYNQLFLDLISIEYLHPIFPPEKIYRIKPEFDLSYQYGGDQNYSVGQQISENILKKGISTIVQKIASKGLLVHMGAYAVTLNPLAIVASFGISKAISYYKSYSKYSKSLEVTLNNKKKIQNMVDFLETTYEECVTAISKYVFASQGSKKKQTEQILRNYIFKVIQRDWLRIQTHKDEQGWQIVQLGEEQGSFYTSVLDK